MVSIDGNDQEATALFPPNEKGLAAMREIAERQQGVHPTNG